MAAAHPRDTVRPALIVRNNGAPKSGEPGAAENAGRFQAIQSRYGRIWFFANDTGAVSRSLARYGEWAGNELGFVRQFIAPGSVVLDVGAYIGTHTLAFAEFVGAEGQVIAFEAQPETYRLLERNVADNHLTNVLSHPIAVGDTVGTVAIPLIDVESAGSFGSASYRAQLMAPAAVPVPHPEGEAGFENVAVGTIDALELERCAVIKIDTEGTESAVIRGAAATIARLSPVIYAECNSIAEGLLTLAELAKLDYTARLHVVNAFAADNFFGVVENIFEFGREVALVAVPRSQADRLSAIAPRECELLLTLETADDLALGLLNKPQYVSEVLIPSVAAASGGAAWIENMTATKVARERAETEASWAKAALAEAQEQLAQAERLRQEFVAIQMVAAELAKSLEQHRTELAEQAALAEAAMRQARAARAVADQSARTISEAEHAKAEAVAAREELACYAEVLTERLMLTEAQLTAMQHSTSWRLTRSLRWVVALLRRGLGQTSAR